MDARKTRRCRSPAPESGKSPLIASPVFAARRRYTAWLRNQLEKVSQRAFADLLPLEDYQYFADTWATQSRFFAIDTLNVLKEELLKLPWDSHLSLLDVGAGAGFGTSLLAAFFRNPHFGYTIDVEALDSSEKMAKLYPLLHGNMSIRLGYVFDVLDASYDIVTCSHMIEHLPREEVGRFIDKLVSISRKFTIITCPWREGVHLHPAHAFSVDDDLIEQVKPDSFTVFHSLGWNNPAAATPLQCLAMVFRWT